MSRSNVLTPLLLVSVCSADEAAIAAEAGVDLIDAKDPLRGALGALPPSVVRDIVAKVGSRARTSAVADTSMGEEALVANVAAMAATSVDYVKLALDPDHGDSVLGRVAAAASGRLIAVAFAEDGLATGTMGRLAAAGFAGAMIDTRGKDGRGLTAILTTAEIADFAASCRALGLLCGLAGSLGVADIPALAAIGPDYLGFRGGLCRDGNRRKSLDPQRVAQAVLDIRANRHRDAA